MAYVAKRCGVKFDPPSIVLVYEDGKTKKMRQRIMPVRNFSEFSDCSLAAKWLKSNARHSAYLQGVSLQQLERLHGVLRDRLRGRTLEQSLAELRPDPDQDLNKLSDEELARRKAHMDVLFERNRKRKDDPDFVYDLEVEFPEADDRETCSWDESEDGF